jgi:hypothetical protein
MCYCLLLVSPGSSFDTVTRFGSTKPRGRVWFTDKTGPPPHAASYAMGTGDFLEELGEWLVKLTDYSPQYSV